MIQSKMQRHRPFGVTIIGILGIIVGLIFLLGGLGLFIAIPIIGSNPEKYSIDSSSMVFQVLTSSFGYAIAGGMVALGIANIATGIGLLKGKQWAWKIAVALAVISLATDAITVIVQANPSSLGGSVIGGIIDGVILYYLFRPHVKAYFGKIPSQVKID